MDMKKQRFVSWAFFLLSLGGLWVVVLASPGISLMTKGATISLSLLLLGIFLWQSLQLKHATRVGLEEKLAEERLAWEKACEEMDKEFQRRGRELDRRRESLMETLRMYHEWLEFPLPDESKSTPTENSQESKEPENYDLKERDDNVRKLLEERAKLFFEKVSKNQYSESGEFQWALLRKDLVRLVEDVARIYQPDAKQPLMETSIEDLLKALHRISLQLILLLDSLPLDVKSYTVQQTYDYVKRGVGTYKVYKAAEPYLAYAKPAFYLGRFALGASPITLGAGFVLGTLAGMGAKQVSSYLFHQYAMTLLHDLLGIVGTEAAGMYGGAYRHRDPNWIYGAELTHLVAQFPRSEEALRHGLNEIGLLQLRSEYDRIFLYRCIAAHRSAEPKNFAPAANLEPEDKQKIAERLERFFDHYIIKRKPKTVEQWCKGVKQRLGLTLKLNVEREALSLTEQRKDVVLALLSFLTVVKEQSWERSLVTVETCYSWDVLSEEERSDVVAKVQEHPPMFLEFPELGAKSPLLENYLEDLVRLQAQNFPHDIRGFSAIEDAVHYFRRQWATYQSKLEKAYRPVWQELLLSESPERKAPLHWMQAVLQCCDPGDPPQFVYGDIELVGLEKLSSAFDWVLLGRDARLVLLGIQQSPEHYLCHTEVVWAAESEKEPLAHFSVEEGALRNDVILEGGNWLMESLDAEAEPMIRIHGHPFTRFSVRFHCLESFFRKGESLSEGQS